MIDTRTIDGDERTGPTAEHRRCAENRRRGGIWSRWGPYLSERAWGTVREDYSHDGSAWDDFPHDHARSRAFRWGEDGLAGLCDDRQTLCFAPALWNGRDPILKERLFGLAGPEGNHGEDVKELYHYLDATPSHAYLKMLYRYPQAAFPYTELVAEGRRRSAGRPEHELADTGVLDDGRYFDVFVEYAKAEPDTILIRITAHNRGPDAAWLHVLPQIWFRNDWSWPPPAERPPLPVIEPASAARRCLHCRHHRLGPMWLYDQTDAAALFTDNVTNAERLWGIPNTSRHVKDAFGRYVVEGETSAVNGENTGSKAAWHHRFEVPAGGSHALRLVLTDRAEGRPFDAFDATFDRRIAEADAFYEHVHHAGLTPAERAVQRQALAGMIWTKQFYMLDMKAWLGGDDPRSAPPATRLAGRNRDWSSLSVADVISMPDKWEYPWFAAWDWAFHAVPLAMVDVEFAKDQLELMLSERLQHPNGQIPAYEWAFSDVNPPVQAWAVWRVYNMQKHANREQGDARFLERCYHKLLLNFTWWVNRKDSHGRNVFQGGFLGLDNISVFDRSQPLPGGGHLEQADATGWMGLYCLNMMAIGLELAQHDRVYEHLGIKFFEHFMHIAAAINGTIDEGLSLWDEGDGWYYDVLHGLPGPDRPVPLKVRSQVGLIPLFAAMVLEHSWFERLPGFKARYEWLLANRPQLTRGLMCVWTPDGARCLLSIVGFDRLRRILERTLDPGEFLSPYGVRALSRHHREQPYRLDVGGRTWTIAYEAGESTTRMFGGNSNWRGPVWFPTNFMLITALRVYDRFFGSRFTVQCPTGSGRQLTLNQAALEIGRRLCALFLPDEHGMRPIYRRQPRLGADPVLGAHPLFYEYFHGDDGAGLGASHQTGWTGLVAKLLDQQAVARAADLVS